MQLYRSTARAATLAALVFGTANAPLADSEETGAMAFLETDEIGPGTTSTLRLRSPLASRPALLIFGETPLAIPLGGALPVLRVGPAYVAIQATTTGTNGLTEIPFGFPAVLPPGLELYGQALVVGASQIFDSNRIALRPEGGPATWVEASNQLPVAVSSQLGTDVDFADLDKDGDFDAVTVGIGDTPRPLILINDGNGIFTEEGGSRIAVADQIGTSVVEIGDANGDGWPDLFIGGAYDEETPAPNLLLLNDGTGHFVRQASFPISTGRPLDAEWADIDGDEDLDLVVMNLEEPSFIQTVAGIEVFENDNGTFTSAATFSSVPLSDPHFSGGGMSLADLDNDGDVDLFAVRSAVGTGWQNELWLNDGDGNFTDSTAFSVPAVADNSFDVSIFDADGDGRQDIFVYNSVASLSNANHLLFNFGGSPPLFVSGNGSIPDSFGALTNIRFSGDAADVDNDGDTDILVGIHALPTGPFTTDGEAVLLLNQGGIQGGSQGIFEQDLSFDFSPAYIDGDPSFADIDGDGDLDLYLGNAGDILETLPPTDRLFINQL